MKKSWNRIGVIMGMRARVKVAIMAMVAMVAAATLCGCEGGKNTEPQEEEPKVDPREAFVGEYTFTSTGNIDLYAGTLKLFTIPMDNKGEMNITLSDSTNAVWVRAENDSTIAFVSGNNLFMEPTTDETTFGELVMQLAFTYGKGTLENDTLSMDTYVAIQASYRDRSLSGNGKVGIVAVRKVESE